MNLSRSVSCSIFSNVWPVCLSRISFRCFLVRMNSLAWIRISVVVPSVPASGW